MKTWSRVCALGLVALLLAGCDGVAGLFGSCKPPSDAESFAFDVTWTRVVQVNQTASNTAPVLAGRPAGIEVLLTLVDGALGAHLFDIRATVDVAVDGESVGNLDLELGCVRGERSAMRGTIPGDWIREGTEVRVTVHSALPNVAVPEEAFVVVPIVAAVPVFEVTIVPLVVGGESPDTSRAIYESWLDAAQSRFAIDAVDLEVRPPLDLGLGDDCTCQTRFAALQELNFQRNAEGSERFFVGVLPCRVGGVAFTPGFVQVTSEGLAAVNTFIHELGHNLNLRHAPCGDPPGVDPSYPYEGGVLGLPGFDAANGAWIPATAPDVMGYCAGAWLSDYHYDQSTRYRMFQERPPVLDALAVEAWPVSLVIQGQLRPDGTVHLTHAVRLWTPWQRRSTAAGDPRETVLVEVVGRDGEVLARAEAELVDIDHVDTRLFSARVGLTAADGFAAETVRASYQEERATRAVVDGD